MLAADHADTAYAIKDDTEQIDLRMTVTERVHDNRFFICFSW